MALGMFGFGKGDQVVPVKFTDGLLTFHSPVGYKISKSAKLQLLLTIGERVETTSVSVTILTSEETAKGEFVCSGAVNLGAKQTVELVRQLSYAGVDGACRRGSRRIETVVRILSRDLPNFHAVTKDVSLSGVQLLCDGPVQPGAYVNLTFDLEAVGVPELTMQAQCIRCVEDYDGGRIPKCRLGVAFTPQHPETHAAWAKYYELLRVHESSSLMAKSLDVGATDGAGRERASTARPAASAGPPPPPPPPPRPPTAAPVGDASPQQGYGQESPTAGGYESSAYSSGRQPSLPAAAPSYGAGQPPVPPFQHPTQSYQPPAPSFQHPTQSYQPPAQDFPAPEPSYQPPAAQAVRSFTSPPPAPTFDSLPPVTPVAPASASSDSALEPAPVWPMGIDGDSFVFRGVAEHGFRVGSTRQVVVEFDYGGQRTTAVLAVAISRVEPATEGLCLCWGALREDPRKIEILNQVLG